jgi:pyruvate/2-oxoglutarate dehydrogenase complex dihydrolipoamide acyltransferase (E2) component
MSLLTELRIPHMGSVENAKLLTWLLPEGSAFKAGQPLYEIETDKTVLEVEAEADGVLARRDAGEGEDMKVGDRVGYAAAPGTTPADVAAALAALAPPAVPPSSLEPLATASAEGTGSAEPPAGESGTRLSPLVRRLAAEHGVDLATV